MAIVFYDTETTGLAAPFDQILQFAAIRTDADLNEIDRFEIRCRIQPHIVASPGALKVTGVTADKLIDPKLPSFYEMVTTIRNKMLEWTPAMFIGYNSITFDEHFMRQALYQSLYPPYLTNTDGNSRSDALMMMHAISVYAPDCFKYPIGNKGKPSFKLDQLAPLNGFNHENAHDALADVEATIHMCRLISDRAPQIWSNFMRFSQKAAVAEYITNEDVFCFSEFFYGQHYSWLVTNIGVNRDNSGEHYVFNLEVDPNELLPLSIEQIADRLKKSPKPLRRLKTNACPILLDTDDALDTAAGKDLHSTELSNRVAILKNIEFRNKLIAAMHFDQTEKPKSIYVEEQIYDGFFTNADQAQLIQFHAKTWENRLKMVDSFVDERIKHLALRLIHAERPDLLNPELLREHDLKRAHRLLDIKGIAPWLTLPKAIKEIDERLSQANEEEVDFLNQYKAYLVDRFEKANQLIAI